MDILLRHDAKDEDYGVLSVLANHQMMSTILKPKQALIILQLKIVKRLRLNRKSVKVK